MLSSIFISESISGMGSAINRAGALRMQSFQTSTNLFHRMSHPETDHSAPHYLYDFESRLYDPLLSHAIPQNPDSPIYQNYQQVIDSWKEQIRPLLYLYENQKVNPLQKESFLSTTGSPDHMHYLEAVHNFVAKIDQLVNALENKIEEQIQTLHLIGLTTLFIAITIVLLTLISLHFRVIAPLQTLAIATERIRQGDFSYRAIIDGNNELSALANTFNAMSIELSETYTNQEREIRDKTADLSQKKNAMELLYHTTRILSQSPTHTKSYDQILEKINQYLGIHSGLICLSSSANKSGHLLASTQYEESCLSDCYHCHDPAQQNKHKITLTIQHRDAAYGLLIIDNREDRITEWQRSTLQIISEQIGLALYIASRLQKEREHDRLQERSSIARELHDSLAQSLSFLKIEVSRSQALLSTIENSQPVQSIIAEVRSELNNAYRQLRELITAFRLSNDPVSIEKSIEQTIESFKRRGEATLITDIRMEGCKITPYESIHLAQILGEALNNAFRHSQADHIWVEFRCTPTHRIILTIQDDGIGLDSMTEKEGHYGLSIMQERAQSINGEYEIKARLGGGTTIVINFIPEQYQNSPTDGNIQSWLNQI
ncbi:MAG: HAMP domain-containing protein [Gammaproteobacteria bacterium]|nr:HAMP domain-containing protein [Gammaproteobacteria bacterium]MBT7307930.1 HAMP domain-containing protein [Gammaproteobacteria bacterium]